MIALRRRIVLSSRWHFHDRAAGAFTIRHVPTFATFATRPTVADRFAVVLIGRAPPLDAAALGVVAAAARFVGVHARLILTCRRQHRGAVYFWYQPGADPADPYWNPITRDAPPLWPHLVRA